MCVNAKRSDTNDLFCYFYGSLEQKTTQRKDYEIYSFVSRKSVQVKGFGEMH